MSEAPQPATGTRPLGEILVDEGALDLTAMAGLAFTMGDGSADPIVRFSGTPADVDAALMQQVLHVAE